MPQLDFAIGDADNHYYERADAFTRHLGGEHSRLFEWAEIGGRRRLIVNGRVNTFIPNPTFDPIGKPGALSDYFLGKPGAGETFLRQLRDVEPLADHPEYVDRDARLVAMDAMNVERAWLLPTLAVGMQVALADDPEACIAAFGSFNRWLDEDWGFAYRDRIFAVPFLTISDVDQAIEELEWCLERGARVVSIRNGPAFTPEGTKSPADPMFDAFWARVGEAGVVMAPHAGFEDGYTRVYAALAEEWGRSVQPGGGTGDAAQTSVLSILMKHRLVHDFAGILVADGLFERHPGVRVAYIENGGTWVGDLLHKLQVLHGQNPGMFAKNPVDQFHDNCWVAPFVEDSVPELAKHIPVERILFGSDWPHAEGIAHPRDFFKKVEEFSIDEQRRIMVENARELTLA
jgi:predicted TIM-barrel fold metal-dependent hydrolase